MTKKSIHTSGKRKHAIARATLNNGIGLIKINNQLLANYSNKIARLKILEPVKLATDNVTKKINIKVKVSGGGFQSQAEACRLAIAKGLVEYTKSDKLKSIFLDYDRHLLVADTRRNEPCKPNDSGKPRRKRQKSYR